MAMADIVLSSCGKLNQYLCYTLYKFGAYWLSFAENRTILLQHINLSHSLEIFQFWIFDYHEPNIGQILMNF